MAYRDDKYLEFLSECDDQSLNDLVYILTHDTDGEVRHTEELTKNKKYIQHYPKHSKYWQEIAGELQCFGGNTFMTVFKAGKGVEYFEILSDVYEKIVKTKPSKEVSTQDIEDQLLKKLLEQSVEKMSPQELADFAKEMKFDLNKTLTPQAVTAAAQLIFKMGGFKSYQLTLIIVNAVSRAFFNKGLTLVANATITRAASLLAGPVGWLITGIWTAVDIAGPAYRVTIPAVIQVILLRKQNELSKEELKKAMEKEFDIDDNNL